MSATAKRVRFVKHPAGPRDYVDARFDVLLDGVKVGEVTSNVEAVETSRSALSTSRIATYREAKVWRAEGVRFGLDRRSRNDAAIDVLQEKAGLPTYAAARRAVTGA